MNISPDEIDAAADARHHGVLEAAVGVFVRYGFRKASMDEVARAAGVSRQGLYLQFANKEELFRRALEHTLDRQMEAVEAALASELPLERRLSLAFEAWAGRFIGSLGADASDLMCAGTTLAGDALVRYGRSFESALAQAVESSPEMRTYRDAGIGSRDIARTLHATARGHKHASASREDFLASMSAAARILCAPATVKDS